MAGRASAPSGDTPSQPSRDLPPAGDTVCVGAILKDEDAFVEEWVAYHRILGVDHFYLYDNDPRQPLSEILARHGDYVTVRPWLIGHDDPSYPGRTKQIKAYTHCLENGAGRYDWVAFIDCDEFIALEEHRDLKAFLAEFEGHDSIALNWHVFGHNGYYDDPPGLVIECLTRRMKEPPSDDEELVEAGSHRFLSKCASLPLDGGMHVRGCKQTAIPRRALPRQNPRRTHQSLSMPLICELDAQA